MLNDIKIFGSYEKGKNFIEKVSGKSFIFSLVISYTATCMIPGITIAGSSIHKMQFTSPSDAEFINYGYCKNMHAIPTTPDGKLTPAVITKTALDVASIPHITINAGSKITPSIPYFETWIKPGNNITCKPALTRSSFLHAINYGKLLGKTLASLTNCLVIGESIPGGTTTALAVLKGLGITAKISSSMPNNPLKLKNKIVDYAISRINSNDPFDIVRSLGDPIIPFIAGILNTASKNTNVILAGGTQMAAVMAFASYIGYDINKISIGTTSYIINDKSADFLDTVKKICDVPVLSPKLELENSKITALQSYSKGFVKDGVGAGGSIITAILKIGIDSQNLLKLIENKYKKLFNSY